MKYKLPETRKDKNCNLSGYVFMDGICEVLYPSKILEKYYKCVLVEDETKPQPKRRGRKPKVVEDGIGS